MKPELIICESDTASAAILRQSITAKLVSVVVVAPHLVSTLDIDAVYMSVRAAEEFGARPVVHHVQILRSDGGRRRDPPLPPHVIAGVALAADDSPDPEFQLWLGIKTIILDVQAFNTSAATPIRKVGVWTGWLGFDRLRDKARAGRIISAAFEHPDQPFEAIP